MGWVVFAFLDNWRLTRPPSPPGVLVMENQGLSVFLDEAGESSALRVGFITAPFESTSENGVVFNHDSEQFLKVLKHPGQPVVDNLGVYIECLYGFVSVMVELPY